MPQKSYLLNRNQSRICRLNGILESMTMPNKPELCQSFSDHVIYSADKLPPKVDFRSSMTAVEDQSKLGSCVANTLAGAYEYLLKKKNGQDIDVSRLFIYYNARASNDESGDMTDSGCSMTEAIQALEQYGVCLESIWPYDIANVNVRPSQEAYQRADEFKITEALKVEIDINQMKSCLAQGFPFAFGLKLFASFDKAAKSGVVPMPDGNEQNRESHGSHALLAVGYSDQSNSFIVRNSWGKYWGDNGYCYIPYAYMTNQNLCFDAWTVRQLASDDFSQDNWDYNDTVDYQSVDQEPYDDDDDDDSGRAIAHMDDDNLIEDAKDFAENLLGKIMSLAF
ncbi:unnamed protein product [Rotaria socialis]|uniref:Peptidase C1A papain C-terminal domain-containing protein n=1 Tax=Rotaria socialis TaxID=392032 RepID=A0A821PLX7_9BILA|nr:unnamed protein product [Rotaria socialis]CAF4808675.1 unnamed protein product [Rotaria socialis]